MSTRLASVRAVLWRGALFALLWWALTDGRPGSWGVGGISVALARLLIRVREVTTAGDAPGPSQARHG